MKLSPRAAWTALLFALALACVSCTSALREAPTIVRRTVEATPGGMFAPLVEQLASATVALGISQLQAAAVSLHVRAAAAEEEGKLTQAAGLGGLARVLAPEIDTSDIAAAAATAAAMRLVEARRRKREEEERRRREEEARRRREDEERARARAAP